MPWEETTMLDSRCKFVAAYLDHELPMAALCRSFGISRTTGYPLVHRYFQEGPARAVQRGAVPGI